MQILVRHGSNLSLSIGSKAVNAEQMNGEGEEEEQEKPRLAHQSSRSTTLRHLIVYIINKVLQAKHAGQEEHGKAQHQVPRFSQCLQAMPPISPDGDHGVQRVAHIVAVHDEVGPVEERCHGNTQQEWAEEAVQPQQQSIAATPQHIAQLALELIADSLQYEAHKNEHPQPVGTTKAGTIEEWKRGKEGSAEGDKRRKRELPLAPSRIDEHAAGNLVISEGSKQ